MASGAVLERRANPRSESVRALPAGSSRTLVWSCRLLVLTTGATALAGQVCWARLAGAAVGGTFTSSVLTLSGAMAGLAVGATVAGVLLGRSGARRLLAGSVVLSAMVLAVMPWLVLGVGGLEGSLGLRRILAVLLLGAAHLPFGAILPCAVAWRGDARDRLALNGGELYALGAFGAVMGGIVAGEVLAPRMALDHLCLLLAGITLLSVAFVLFPRKGGEAEAPLEDPGKQGRMPRMPVIVAASVGFLGMITESVWLRGFAFYWGANTLSYAWVTASYIGGLALGAWAASRLPGRYLKPGTAAVGLALSGFGLAVAASQAAAAVGALTPWDRLTLSFLLVGVPATFFGATFVVLLGCLGGKRSAGRTLGIVVGANSAGAAAGPIVLWLASPWMPWPPQVLAGVACAYALLVFLLIPRRVRETTAAALFVAAVGLLGWSAAPSGPAVENYGVTFGAGPMPGLAETVLPFNRNGLEANVVVTRNTRSGVEVLWIDRGFQGDTSPLGRHLPAELGRLPGRLLGRASERAMVIGLGTGITLSEIVRGGAKSVDVAELSRGVVEANRSILAEANGRVLERGGVRVHLADGRQVLADAEAPYDLIVTDMIFPDVVGAASLFSREFYDLARRRLMPDGVFVHWVPSFLMAPEDVSATVSAFLEAFPDGTAWIGFFGPRRFVLGLAGGAVPAGCPSRLALGSSELSRLAGNALPIRDADPRMEYRSNTYRAERAFGRENLRIVMELMREGAGSTERAGRAWLRVGEARLAEEEGALERAAALYREAIREAPGSTDAEILLDLLSYERDVRSVRAAAARGDGAGVMRALRRTASSALHGEGNLALADELATRGRLHEAIGELERAIGKAPRSADAHVKLALLALTVRDFARAKEALGAARSLRPDEPALYRDAARWIDRRGD